MEFDPTQFLAAVVQNEGGRYTIPFAVFDEISSWGDTKALAFDPVDGGMSIDISLVDSSDIVEDTDV